MQLDNWIKVEYFKTIYSDEVEEFLDSLDDKACRKIIYNVDKAKLTHDPELFKNLILIFGSLGQNIKRFNIAY